MQHVTLDGTQVPALGLGTWQMHGDECTRAVSSALALGYRHIDTAAAYENEDAIGRALAASRVDRAELFLTTKVWLDYLEPPDTRRSVEASLARLGVEAVDLALIHWPNAAVPVQRTLDALQALKQEGKLRYYGVSNFTPELLEVALAHAPVSCIQVEYHPYLAQMRLLKMAADHGLLFTAYCPLARGRIVSDPALIEIGARYGKGPAQVALRWLLQQDRVAAIPKASSPEHQAANLAIFDFELSPDEVARIHQLDRGERLIDPAFAPEWGQAA